MPDSETMRSRALERIAAHSPAIGDGIGTCNECGRVWPCADFVANTRNLHDLNNADEMAHDEDCDETGVPVRNHHGRGVWIPDDPLGGDHAE